MRKIVLMLSSITFLVCPTLSVVSCYYNPSNNFTDAEKIASIKNLSQKEINRLNLEFPTYFTAELQRELDDKFSEFFSKQNINSDTQVALTSNLSTGIIANELFVQIAKKDKNYSWFFPKTRVQSELFSFNNFNIDRFQETIEGMFNNINDWMINVTLLDEFFKPWLLTEDIFIPEVIEPVEPPEEVGFNPKDENTEEPELIYYNVDLSKLGSYPRYFRFNVLGKVIFDDYGNVILEGSNPNAIVYDRETNQPLKQGRVTFDEQLGPIMQGLITSSPLLAFPDSSFVDNTIFKLSPATLDYSISIFDFWNNVSEFEKSL